MLHPVLLLLVKGPPLLLLAMVAVYAFDIGGGRQPIIDAYTAAAEKVGIHMARNIAPQQTPTPTAPAAG